MSLPTKIQKFKDLEQDFGTTVAVALWQKAVQLMNYIEQSYPIGFVMFVHETQASLPAEPDSKYWAALDGSTVSNANSPMNGVALPDFRDRFFRNAATGETLYTPGGADSLNLAHDHFGVTAGKNPRGAFNAAGSGDFASQGLHLHTISSDLTTVSVVPQYIALKAYIRIA